MKSISGCLLPVLVLGLAACGGGAPAASSPVASSPAAAASAKPASAAPSGAAAAASTKPAASAAAKPASGSAAAKPAASGLQHVEAAYSQASITQTPMYVGADLGMFNKYGLDVTAKQVGGTQQIPALVSNEIQFAGVGASEIANANLGGTAIVIIATAVDVPFFQLYVNSKYKAVADLAGQSIGITTPGSSTDSTARLILQKYNMTGKVKITPAGGTQASILAAMTQGGIAGGILTSPTSEQAAKAGFTELVDGVTMGVPASTNSLGVTRAYLQSNRETVLNFLRGYQDAWTFISNPANEDAVVKVIAKYTKSDEDSVRPGYERGLKYWQTLKVPTENPEAVTNLLKLSDNPKAANANPNDFIDNSLLESIQPK
ncbi:MAG TPA: ABC transporter substrate-binding protein [Chloroflexota bacterium]|nr:ABC transporter substrate-binding protein [Chloroflexota bacterium]